MHVLLTGAAGLIGSEVAALLAARCHAVTALVHRNPRLSRNDGSAIETRSFTGRCPGQGEVAIIAGDIRQPGLGLPDDLHDALRSEADLVLHCAALTGFGLEPGAYAAVNVGGTANVLAFAERRSDAGIPVLHVSTAYVCGVRSGVVPEGPVGTALFVNGYETSKAEAERLVAQAQGRGLQVAVARPSIVVGDWASGRIRDFDSLYLAFRMIAREQDVCAVQRISG